MLQYEPRGKGIDKPYLERQRQPSPYGVYHDFGFAVATETAFARDQCLGIWLVEHCTSHAIDPLNNNAVLCWSQCMQFTCLWERRNANPGRIVARKETPLLVKMFSSARYFAGRANEIWYATSFPASAVGATPTTCRLLYPPQNVVKRRIHLVTGLISH